MPLLLSLHGKAGRPGAAARLQGWRQCPPCSSCVVGLRLIKKKKKENTHKEKERNHKRFYMINPMCSMLVRLELETDFARLKNHELLPSLMGV